jgi:hypothetical protein
MTILYNYAATNIRTSASSGVNSMSIPEQKDIPIEERIGNLIGKNLRLGSNGVVYLGILAHGRDSVRATPMIIGPAACRYAPQSAAYYSVI